MRFRASIAARRARRASSRAFTAARRCEGASMLPPCFSASLATCSCVRAACSCALDVISSRVLQPHRRSKPPGAEWPQSSGGLLATAAIAHSPDSSSGASAVLVDLCDSPVKRLEAKARYQSSVGLRRLAGGHVSLPGVLAWRPNAAQVLRHRHNAPSARRRARASARPAHMPEQRARVPRQPSLASP